MKSKQKISIVFFLSFFILHNCIHANYDVIGFGSPCVDMVYKVNDNFLESMPVSKGDGQRASWEIFSFVLEVCKTHKITPVMTTGGSGSNTIKGLASLNNKTAIIGKIGEDDKGNFYRKTIENLGITPFLIPSQIPTTQIGVFVTSDFQRTFLSFPGAGHSITSHDFSVDNFANTRLVHIDGYMLEDIPCVEKVMEYAKQQGALVSLDMGCLRIAKTYSQEILRLLSTYVDIAFANEDEIEALLHLSPSKGCKELSKYCEIAVILVGKEGCWVGSNKGIFHSSALNFQTVDTTGAGDLFSAGFLHGYLRGYSLVDCAWLGNLIGGTCVTVVGAEIPEEKWVMVRKEISKHFKFE